ncbi:hypothetical protein [Paraburkholderia domus]|uniref:hypothetical protein n=1 Tax=Paraburkholderia domus TaxID=2793075 RepID=UPI001B0FBBD2|nr:hypothetical protein [Paraburkholderia domus]CAE6747683.1 hypothetical protein R75483_02973 [Paraburkholderia domus]
MTYTTRNPHRYTAQQFVEDASATLPSALPLIHASGRLTTCGSCGAQHDGTRFGTYMRRKEKKIVGVEIVAVCNACAAGWTILDCTTKNLGETSSMFVPEASWVSAAIAFRELGSEVAKRGGLPHLIDVKGSGDD